MIHAALDILTTELTNSGISAELGNVGEILSGAGNNHGSNADVIVSLINIEEERVGRNPQHYIKRGDGILFKNPAIHLNLTALFTSVRHEAGYGLALQHVQEVIGFFQAKYVFDQLNTPAIDPGIERLTVEMVSYNIDQLHQLWSMLGGKYHPSVAYKIRMIVVDSVSNITGPLIKEIETNYFLK